MSRSPRGGLGVRHAQARRQAQASGYRLTGVKAGSRVAETDKYRRWHLYYRLGTILRNSITSVTVQWDDEDEWSHYTSEEARYRVDTNRWRITPPEQHSPLTALTSGAKSESIMPSPPNEGTDRRKRNMTQLTAAAIDRMTLPQLRKEAEERFEADDLKGLRKADLQKLLKDNLDEEPVTDEVDDEDELDDEVDDTADEADDDEEELDEPAPKEKVNDAPKGHKPDTSRQTPPEPSGETLTAKQVATRIGTDAKTLRKFFRSPASTVEAVGQGGRYEFAKDDLPKIKAEFEKWNSGKTTRTKRAADEPKKPTGRMAAAQELEDDDEIDDTEPTDDELEDLDDLELDDDEELELDDEEED